MTDLTNRITTADLMLAGWHGIYTGGKQFWSHPDWCPILVRFKEAVKVQKKFGKHHNEYPEKEENNGNRG